MDIRGLYETKLGKKEETMVVYKFFSGQQRNFSE